MGMRYRFVTAIEASTWGVGLGVSTDVSLATTSSYFVMSLTSISATMSSDSDLKLAISVLAFMSSLGLDAILRFPISFYIRVSIDASSAEAREQGQAQIYVHAHAHADADDQGQTELASGLTCTLWCRLYTGAGAR
jgi:hypothetical protein